MFSRVSYNSESVVLVRVLQRESVGFTNGQAGRWTERWIDRRMDDWIDKKGFIRKIGSCDYGGWEEMGLALQGIESQGSCCCGSVEV